MIIYHEVTLLGLLILFILELLNLSQIIIDGRQHSLRIAANLIQYLVLVHRSVIIRILIKSSSILSIALPLLIVNTPLCTWRQLVCLTGAATILILSLFLLLLVFYFRQGSEGPLHVGRG